LVNKEIIKLLAPKIISSTRDTRCEISVFLLFNSTKWKQVKSLRKFNGEQVICCLKFRLIVRYKILTLLALSNASYLFSLKLSKFSLIKEMGNSSNYLTLENGIQELMIRKFTMISKGISIENYLHWTPLFILQIVSWFYLVSILLQAKTNEPLKHEKEGEMNDK